jgi:RNA polymerase sigma factor (sigma-70 family)
MTATQSRRFVRTGGPTRRHGPLSADLECRLIAEATGGDEQAREQLVLAFLPWISGVARTYRNSPSIDRSELMQEGVVGLLRAVERFDAKLGTPFWAYASWWVRQAMQQVVSEMTRPVVLSDRALRQLARVRDARRDQMQSARREPSSAELAEATGFSRERVDRLKAAERAPRSLDEPLATDDDSSGTVGEMLADPVSEDGYIRVDGRLEVETLRALAAGLDTRERIVLEAHYGVGRPAQTLREIA